jgi:hypothetical protein
VSDCIHGTVYTTRADAADADLTKRIRSAAAGNQRNDRAIVECGDHFHLARKAGTSRQRRHDRRHT